MGELYVSAFRSPGGNEHTEALKKIFRRVRETAPRLLPCAEPDPYPGDGRIKAIRFSGMPCGGRETSVFAYIGFPEGASAENPAPGMVLVHGGGGHAYAEWVRAWTDRGWAAISFDGFGQRYVGTALPYHEDVKYWGPDPASHLPVDCFASAGKPFAEQWFTYYIADVILSHNLLRCDGRVQTEKIGLTGISWGGVAVCTAVGYDSRFAFAAPVYGCGFMDKASTPRGRYFRGDGVSDVWDAKLLLGEVNMPFHLFTGDSDPFFDAAVCTANAAAASRGALTLLPEYPHAQIEGAAVPELIRFAEEHAGSGQRNIRITSLIPETGGAALTFTLPPDVPAATAAIRYKTEGFVFRDEEYMREPWRTLPGETEGGRARLSIPEDAALFYFIVQGETDGAEKQTLHATSGVFTPETWARITDP